MSFSAVSTLGSATANGFTLTPHAVGNFVLLGVTGDGTTTSWATALSGSNITWTLIPGTTHLISTTGANTVTQAVFIGKVTTASGAAQTITFNTGSPSLRIAWQEFSNTAGFTAVTVDAVGTVDVNASGHFPAVTPTRANDLYWSYVFDNGTFSNGSTSGYTYQADANGNPMAYNLSCANATQTPNIGDTADGTTGYGVMLYENVAAPATHVSLPRLMPPGRSSPAALARFAPAPSPVPYPFYPFRVAPVVSQSSGGVTSYAVSKQGGTQPGDWVLIYLFGTDAGTAACTGFTVVNDSDNYGCLLYRQADGTEGSSFTVTGLSGASVTAVIATTIGGSLDQLSVNIANAATSFSNLSITLTLSNDYVFWFAGNEDGFSSSSFAITPPAGFTAQVTNGAQSTNPAAMLASSGGWAAGATGDQTGTCTSSSFWSGFMLGWHPLNAVIAAAGLATATGTALQPAAQAAVTPGAASATAAAQSPAASVTAAPAAASATATAATPAITASGTASPGAASATAAAQSPVAGVTVTPAAATATATAVTPTASSGTIATPAAASATATAQSPALIISTTVTPGVASATATAKTPAPSLQTAPAAAPATGTAQTPAKTIQAAPGAATSTATARAPAAGPHVTPAVATATATAQPPSNKTVTVVPAVAQGTATALSAGFPTPLKHWGVTFAEPGPAAVLTENALGGTLTVPSFGGVLVPATLNGVLTTPNLGGSLAAPNYGATLSLANLSAVVTGGTMQQASLTLSEFNDMTINIAVTNNGSPFNLTGYSLNLLLKSQAGVPDSSALTFSSTGGSPAITITSASAGLATAQLPNADLDAETYNFYRLDVVSTVGSLQQTTVYGSIIWITL